MDDLISRSAAIEEINKIVREYQGRTMIPSIFSAVAVLQNQPTAYNVDKVVEQLYELGGVDGFDDCAKAYDRAIEDSIKVVKAGGLNE